ncbi:hypothetical protein V495_05288 [Pseudogymnoascus sp. VKM F-4514 (FW-929)]|nr:hypothetical protein V495_05288 [Pseudogymnoascus sp. VKM F-4514 (FW-929)]KFY58882.1 hypothetical protein V497_04598 [Pseudogymnoascus sp. VKM F-4516 (FW-969)]
MINNSRLEYIFIRACILFLHYLTPVSIFYTVFLIASYIFGIPRPSVPLAINVIAIAESLFYLVVFLPYSAYLQREAVHPPVPSRPERKALFEKCYKYIPDPDTYLDRWFLGAPPEEIKRENVKEFVQWAFFNRGGEAGDDDEELEEYVAAYETMVGRKFEPGRGKAESLRLTLDPIDMLHRSLAWYMCVGFVDLLAYISLLRAGFHFHRTSLSRFFTLFPFRPQTVLATKRSPVKYTTYWHRPHTSTTHLPILYIHGIGIGLYPYVPFLSDINKSKDFPFGDGAGGQIGIIALEIHSVSFRLTHAPLSPAVLCAEIASILNKHDYSRVVLATHSYGSVIATHLLAQAETAPMIADIVLIDPVTILLHLPDVAYNFTRRPPQSASEHQLWYFASMDMGVAHSLARHFFWSENVLWKEALEGRDVTVSLAGRDLIVNTEAVGRYLAEGDEQTDDEEDVETRLDASEDGGLLTEDAWKRRSWRGKGIDILWFDDLDHAQVFDTPATRRPVLEALRAYSANGGVAAGEPADSD